MKSNRRSAQGSDLGRIKMVSYASLAVGVASILFVAVLASQLNAFYHQGAPGTTTTTTSYKATSVSGMLITPPLMLVNAPVVTADQPFGSRLTNINAALNSTELSVINGAPQAYFVTAAQMYLNKSLSIAVGANVFPAPMLVANGKPSVVYLGAISCIYCGENRWAMALALGQFGSFQYLFEGYSSFGDADVPTLYWGPADYNSSQYSAAQSISFGNFYTSSYVNFVSMEGQSQITGGFIPPNLSYLQQDATALANPIYSTAANTIINLNNYNGTPYTIWGKFSVPGADAQNFGDASANSTTSIPMASLTHEQVLALLANPHTPFGWNEYAAADFYISLLCASMSSPAPVCSLPGVSTMVSQA
ncbi:MAG: DUF929 family protein [Nitrososphaerota archaeon]|nr:DUF929 family protein [Nitrososphaerota archaeon]MDG6978857.1 DUF929 family protein [Nitrososphaerota archaeon]MDG7021370.1 DUF929 family protein [Nitrososphaerota archaeon]